jgi:DnaJ-domain-containing protein 1
MDHVRAYNKSYNYFDGMPDKDIGDWIKAASTGHRPTWKLGENSWAEARRARERKGGGNGHVTGAASSHDADLNDPHRMFDEHADAWRGRSQADRRPVRNAERKALDTLGLEPGATSDEIKAQYKSLVKRFHPDANGGSRDMEDRFREIVQAYDYLKTAGVC